ncbi:hypothetical protein ACFQ7O_35705 [Streptomyces sp. NPDC056485]|uniref:hypothetical protein n=1 Tax=Streptomyces sp. NPDC056485 TaxID=3345834 RepID=UPI0036A03EE7
MTTPLRPDLTPEPRVDALLRLDLTAPLTDEARDILSGATREDLDAVLGILAGECRSLARIQEATDRLYALTRPYADDDEHAVWAAVARMPHEDRVQALEHIHVLEQEGAFTQHGPVTG